MNNDLYLHLTTQQQSEICETTTTFIYKSTSTSLNMSCLSNRSQLSNLEVEQIQHEIHHFLIILHYIEPLSIININCINTAPCAKAGRGGATIRVVKPNVLFHEPDVNLRHCIDRQARPLGPNQSPCDQFLSFCPTTGNTPPPYHWEICPRHRKPPPINRKCTSRHLAGEASAGWSESSSPEESPCRHSDSGLMLEEMFSYLLLWRRKH